MKALILSGGKGTRLRPITYTSAKQLIPLANKPVLFYAIEAILAAGIRQIGLVVGDTHQEIRAAVGDGSRWGSDVAITYIQQEAPLGLAHAVKIAHPFIGQDRFVLFLGDNFIQEPLGPLVERFSAPDCPDAAEILLARVPNPTAFGVAELAPIPAEALAAPPSALAPAPAGRLPYRIVRLVEKPPVPPSDLALVGIYLFDQHIFEAASAIRPSQRNELEITDAIQWLIEHGQQVRPHLLEGYWIDTGKMADILEANRITLGLLKAGVHPSALVDGDSSLSGMVVVEAGAEISNSVVRGPAIIGERTKLMNSYIGPFTSIYHDATISHSEIEQSIVLEGCIIRDVTGRIADSLIGRYTEIHCSPLKPKAYKLMLGDHSKVGLV
jgi:glucose-1-phosphate thymidylyltransferase